MRLTALCITLLMNFSVVLVSYVQHSYPQTSDSVFYIIPTRLQLFEYESVSFTCKGFNASAEWKVRNIKEIISGCSDGPVNSGITCTIQYAFVSDSGEYWCEGTDGERSNTVTIAVTAGSVILESPVLPVIEGDNVSLRCRNKRFSNLTAHFYKNDLFIGTSDNGNMTIHSVSKSHEGLYKCVSGAEESPINPVTVGALDVILERPNLPVTEGEAVTLHCRIKQLFTKFPAVFYKNGVLIGTSSTGNLTIHSVCKCHEGFYNCNITGVGESPGGWLTVRELHRDTFPCPNQPLYIVLLLRTIFTIVLVPLLLLLVGLIHCGKLGRPQNKS